MMVYIPLQIEKLGFSQVIIGITISLCMLPLIILEERAGKKSDKVGLKPFFLAGFGILAGGCIAFMGLEQWPMILIAAFVLVHMGAALIEPLKDTFLFKTVKKQDTARYF
jgi:MFS family permease